MDACPSDDALADYLGGVHRDAASLAAHIEGCSACFTLLCEIGRFQASGGEPVDELQGPLAPGDTLGRYAIEGVLGRGAMGVVYAAHDPELQRQVAIKVLRARVHDQFRLLREARSLASLRHPNVVQVYDAGRSGGLAYVAMELIRGRTLTSHLAELSHWRPALAWFVAAGRGLAAAHTGGIVHADFKPDNVLVADDGRVVVSDFGLARTMLEPGGAVAASPEGDDGRLVTVGGAHATQTGAVLGTPAFMAPEVLAGRRADAASDQFSFCVAAHLGLTGAWPPSGVIAKPPAWPRRPAVPRRIMRVILRGLDPEPARRWPSMDALVDALGRAGQRMRTGVVVGAVALLGLGAVTGAQAYWQRQIERGCDAEAEALSRWWHDEARAPIERALLDARGDVAAEPWAQIDRRVGEYVAQWSAGYATRCRAARTRREAPDPLWETAAACFADRRQTLLADVEIWRTAEPDVVGRALEAVTALPPIAACTDDGMLRSRGQFPRSTLDESAAAPIWMGIARAGALQRAGRYDDARGQAQHAFDAAAVAGDARLQAEAGVRLGSVLLHLEATDQASGVLQRATAEASKLDDVDLGVRALLMLVGAELDRGAPERADVWAEVAAMRIDEARGLLRPEVDSDLILARADVEVARDHPDRAIELLRDGLAAYEATGSTTPEQRIDFLTALAQARFEADALLEARDDLRAAVALSEDAFGPHHPFHAVLLQNLATLEGELGNVDDALALMERAQADVIVGFGEDSATHAELLGNLAKLEGARDLERALALYRRSHDGLRLALGPTHPSTLAAARDVVAAFLDVGRPQQARPLLDELLGPGFAEALPPAVRGALLVHRGSVAYYAGDLEVALADMRAAEPLLVDDGIEREDLLHNLGVLLTKLGSPDDGIAKLDASIAVCRRIRVGVTAACLHHEVSLAEAYVHAGDRERGRAMLARAIAEGAGVAAAAHEVELARARLAALDG